MKKPTTMISATQRTYLYCFLTAVLFTACIRPQERQQRKIETLEQELSAAGEGMPSFELADSLVKMYADYALAYQDDTLSPSYVFKAGELCMKVQRYREAIGYFNQVQRYRNFRRLGEALFFQGFIYDAQLQDTANARSKYEQFIQNYPQHALADDARHLLENLVLTPDELIRKLEAGHTADTTVAP